MSYLTRRTMAVAVSACTADLLLGGTNGSVVDLRMGLE